MKNQFFISYSRKDTKFVDNLENSLREAGILTWVDRGRLSAGEAWTESIAQALEQSLAVIFVISPDSIRSTWVKKETVLACNKNKRLIPIIYRRTEIPPGWEFLVGDSQHLDFTDKSYEAGIRDLVNAIHQHDASASTIDEKASTEIRTVNFCVEDIVEFLSNVPRLMLWRILLLNGHSLWNRVFRIFTLKPPGLLASWAITFALLALLFLLLFTVTSIDFHILRGLFFICAALTLPFQLICYVAGQRWFKRAQFEMVAKIWQELPFRSDHKSPNKLLDRWHSSIKHILWKLLVDKSSGPTSEDISKRCPDPDLAAHVNTIYYILTVLCL